MLSKILKDCSKTGKKGIGGDKEGNWGQSQETRTREGRQRSQCHVPRATSRRGRWEEACENPGVRAAAGPGAALEAGRAEGGDTRGRSYVPVAVSGSSGCSSRGCGCSSGLCISVGCISALRERRELTLQRPLPLEGRTNIHPPTRRPTDTGADANTDTHVGRGCFKLHQSACYSSVQEEAPPNAGTCFPIWDSHQNKPSW